MGEPVEESTEQAFVLKDLSPVAEGQVGGNQQGAPLVALADEGKEQMAPLNTNDLLDFVPESEE